ncbi:MAG: hypothetical protein U5K00_05015 [Melioribacteraceae bacterium]|nr:hypothetical protein [Melioribacteraceae bacterium]
MYLYDILHLNSEQEAEEYLQEKGVLSKFTHCIHCNSTSLGRIRRGKYKCYNCKREWDPKKNSFLEPFRLDSRQFLLAVKCLSLSLPYYQCAAECRISKRAARDFYSKITQLIRSRSGIMSLGDVGLSFTVYNSVSQGIIFAKADKRPSLNDIPSLIAHIKLKRTRTVKDIFKYEIETFEIAEQLKGKLIGRASKVKQELTKHLARSSHIDIDSLEAELTKFLFYFNSRSKNRTEEILKICSI